jgi:hypothetical protein
MKVSPFLGKPSLLRLFLSLGEGGGELSSVNFFQHMWREHFILLLHLLHGRLRVTNFTDLLKNLFIVSLLAKVTKVEGGT